MKNLNIRSIICIISFLTVANAGVVAQNAVQVRYDCKKREFVTPPPAYLKANTSVSLRFIKVNPMFLQTNLHVTTYTAPDTNAYFKGLFASAFSGPASAGKGEELGKSGNLKDVGNKNHPADTSANATKVVRDITKEDSAAGRRFVESCMAQVKTINKNIVTVNKMLLLDSAVINLMHDPGIADSEEFKARIGIVSADYITTETKNALDAIYDAGSNLEVIVIEFKLAHASMISGNVDISAFINKLEEGLKAVHNSFYGDALSGIQRKINNTRSNYIKMISQEYAISSGSTIMSGDLVTIQDSLTGNGQRFLSPLIIPIHTYGDFKITFSLGFAATFFDLNPTGYFLLRDTANKVDSIGSSRKNSIGNFSPIAFVNWMFRCKGALSPGLSVGLNPDFSSLTNSRLLLGGSLGFTQSDNWYKRFMISAGVGFGMTDCLKPKYDGLKKEDFAGLQNISDSDLTEKAFRIGGFLSFTFTL